MGTADTVTKAYMRNNIVFADAFNYLIYDGQTVIKASDLHEVDTAEIALPFGPQTEKDSKSRSKYEYAVQKYRDILKRTVVMHNDKASYILLGIENQTEIHYAMPVRNMLYDAMQYSRQVSEIAANHRKNRPSHDKCTNGEYLSGFYKDDKIIPVITLVIHFGTGKWDGPLSLSDMMNIKNSELAAYVQDYKIHLIDPADINEKDLNKFSTNLREVIACIKYAGNKESMRSFITYNQHMMLDKNAARVINAVTGTSINISDEKEEIDMCEAWKGIMEDCREEGKVKALASLVHDGLLDIKIAADRANMSESELQEVVNKLS